MTIDDFEAVFRPPQSSAGPHTLDSPIRYEVWRSYADQPAGEVVEPGADDEGAGVDLLLEPAEDVGATLLATLGRTVQRHGVDLALARPARVGGLVAVRLPFAAFLEIV